MAGKAVKRYLNNGEGVVGVQTDTMYKGKGGATLVLHTSHLALGTWWLAGLGAAARVTLMALLPQ